MIILDTCAFIWDALNHPKLTLTAKTAIKNAELTNTLMICDITLWEVAMLVKKGRLKIDTTAQAFSNLALQARDIGIYSITTDIAELSVNFDQSINDDPADRLIAATSVLHNAVIITADNNLRKSSLIETLW